MKKGTLLLALISIITLQGCASHRINTRDSFVQVLKTVEVSGCGVDKAKEGAQKCATFVKMSGVGSGAIVWNERSIGGKPRTLVMTADHVCHAENNFTQDKVPANILSGFKRENGITGNISFNISNVEIVLKDSRGIRYPTAPLPILRNPEADVCVVESSINKPAIAIAREEPEFGEKVVNVSAPYGLMFTSPDGGAVYITEGLYSGNFMMPNSPRSMYTIWTAPGSSGSPILNERGEIVGMVSAISIATWPRLSTPMVGVVSAPSNITFGPTIMQVRYSVKEAIAALKRGKPFIYAKEPIQSAGATEGSTLEDTPEEEGFIAPFIWEWE